MGFAGLALSSWQVYDDIYTGHFGAHTVVNATVSVVFFTAGVAAAGLATTSAAALAGPAMLGVAVAGFGYGVASAVGLDEEIDQIWNNHAKPLQQKFLQRIHHLK